MQGLCHDQSDWQGVQSQMVLSIGSTPLIRMPFLAASIHIRPSSLKHFISRPFVRLELCLPSGRCRS